jgi:hypothetical protein
VSRRSRVVSPLLAVAMASGCAGPFILPTPPKAAVSPRPATSARPATSPSPAKGAGTVVDSAAAQRQLDAYVKVNNQANQARSDTLLRSYESGSSLDIDLGSYKSSRALKPKGRKYVPFGYVDPVFAFPTGRPWYLIDARQQDMGAGKKPAGTHTYLLFAKKGQDWKQTYSPGTPDAKTELPKPTTEAIDPGDSAGLIGSPAEFAKLYAVQLAGRTPAGKDHFESDSLVSSYTSDRIKMSRYSTVKQVVKPATAYPTYALRTADGGALVFTTMNVSLRYDVIQGGGNYVYATGNGFLRGKYRTYMQQKELLQVAGYIPPKNAQNPKYRLIGSYSGTISGSGA